MLSISRYHQCPSLFSKLSSAMSVTPAKTTFPFPLLLLRAPLAIGSNGLCWSVYILSLRDHKTFKKFMKYWFGGFGGFGWNKHERINFESKFFRRCLKYFPTESSCSPIIRWCRYAKVTHYFPIWIINLIANQNRQCGSHDQDSWWIC